MGASSDSAPDRGPAPQTKSIDDDWTDRPADNDRTTYGYYVEPTSPRSASAGDHDRTKIGTGADRIVPATSEPVVSIDHTLDELEASAVASSVAKPFAIVGGHGVTIPREEEHKLVQPERSPLAFVITDEKPNAVPRARGSNDSSRFISALVGDDPPPVVDGEAPVISTMQPVLRRRRLRRQWGALAVVVVVGAVVAIKLATFAHAPRATADVKVATVATVPAPPPVAPAPPPVAPAPPPVAPAPPPSVAPESPTPAPSEPAAPEPPATPPETAAATTTSTTPTSEAPAKSTPPKPAAKPKLKSTAMANHSSAANKPSAKKSTTAKKPTTKKSTTTEDAWPRKKRSF